MDESLHRVMVVGVSCSGKSTFARQLSQHIDGRHIELDALHWQQGWKGRPRHEFLTELSDLIEAERWVCDGGYSFSWPTIWPRATALVWLNYSLPLVWKQAWSRTWNRVRNQEELWNGNRESFRHAYLSRNSILLWVLQSYGKIRRTYREVFASNEYGHLKRIELRSPREAQQFFDALGEGSRGSQLENPARR